MEAGENGSFKLSSGVELQILKRNLTQVKLHSHSLSFLLLVLLRSWYTLLCRRRGKIAENGDQAGALVCWSSNLPFISAQCRSKWGKRYFFLFEHYSSFIYSHLNLNVSLWWSWSGWAIACNYLILSFPVQSPPSQHFTMITSLWNLKIARASISTLYPESISSQSSSLSYSMRMNMK